MFNTIQKQDIDQSSRRREWIKGMSDGNGLQMTPSEMTMAYRSWPVAAVQLATVADYYRCKADTNALKGWPAARAQSTRFLASATPSNHPPRHQSRHLRLAQPQLLAQGLQAVFAQAGRCTVRHGRCRKVQRAAHQAHGLA